MGAVRRPVDYTVIIQEFLAQDFKLIFADYAETWKGATATIVESPGDIVWGVVWEILKEEEVKLDRQEIYYKPIKVTVWNEDGAGLECKSYQKLTVSDDSSLPSVMYKTVMIHGAKEHQLPEDYVQRIEAVESNGYKGEAALDSVK